jgi:predicted alpha/beta superfamily hydrolase
MKWRSIKVVILFLALYSSLTAAAVIDKDNFELSNSSIFTVDSKVLGRKYDIFVKLPRDYSWEGNQSKKYPVLYLNDGPYTFKVAAGVTHRRQMDKVIVVGISFAHGENGQFSRVRDLTPVIDKSWNKYTTGGANKYLEFIEKEVLQFIEQNYRVNTEQRILSGQSLGGLFGAWVLLTKPELFSTYILTSP